MSELSITTAAIIRFSEALQDKSSAFYTELAERWPDEQDAFLTFARDGAKNKTLIVRTYQETISDALEASYSFAGLRLAEHEIETTLPAGAGYPDALEAAIALEETACGFYVEVAERSESLLATIPRAFRRVVKNREKRKTRLERMLQEAR